MSDLVNLESFPSPGTDEYTLRVEALLADAKLALIAAGTGNPTLVRVQAKRAVLLQRVYELSALIAIESDDYRERDRSLKYGKLAIEASTQQTRALKQISADRLTEIEEELEKRTKAHGDLRAIK